jgi:tetratricopeptide (TPR) repeat protein
LVQGKHDSVFEHVWSQNLSGALQLLPTSSEAFLRTLAIAGAIFCFYSSSAVAVENQSGDLPNGSGSASVSDDASNKSGVLQGSAEMSTIRADKNVRAMQASLLYKQGVAALNTRDYRFAADRFKQAEPGFDSPGYEKYLAETKYAEAQSRRLLGQKEQAKKLYQEAIDLFNEYDPLSPYLKPALDYLKKLAPQLSGRVKRDEARLAALSNPTRMMTVDRNVVLKGGLSNYGGSLLLEKGTADVASDYVHNTIHKAFVRMTCLETTELGSNYITAEGRWYPLLASGRTVAIAASSDFLVPTISIKINERFYNVPVELPGLGMSKRTVFMLTDGNHVIAIDPATEDMWNLDADFSQRQAKFSWRKLTHFKPKRKS